MLKKENHNKNTNKKIKIIGVIPARYSSTRLPGKPLLDICGLPMVIHTMKRSMMSKVLDEVIVATDDQRIFDIVTKNGGQAMMTETSHENATVRLYEVSKKKPADIYVLILGDEALVKPDHINKSAQSLLNNKYEISILYNKFYKKNSPSDQKVVINNLGEIMYISRSDIPSDYKNKVDYYHKAYFIVSLTHAMLEKYMSLPQTRYDFIESNEFTRILENGHKIKGVEVTSSAISVDTTEDLEIVRKMMKEDEIFKIYKDNNQC